MNGSAVHPLPMQTLQSWRTLERYALCGATQRQWICSTGIQWAELTRWLKPCRARARWVGDPELAGHRLSVVQIGDEFLATSEQTPPHRSAISLTLADITLYALNVATLAEHYGERLGIAWDAPRPQAHGLWKIGVWSRPTHGAKPVFLFLPESVLGGCQELHRAIGTVRDCVLICCTAEHLRGDTAELARERGVDALVLADLGLEPLPLDNLRGSASATVKSTARKARQLLDVPHGCVWKDVRITIHRTRAVTFRVRKEEKRLSLHQLGLRGRDKNTPSALFLDLCSIAAKQCWEPKGVRGRTGEKRLERLKDLLREWVPVRGEPFVKHGRQVLPNFGITLDGDTPRNPIRNLEDTEEPADDQHVDYGELSGFSITTDRRFRD